MIKEANVTRVECRVCGHRLMDKGEEAYGLVQAKCSKCKRVWEVDLATGECKLISGKAIPRRKGV